MKRPDQASDDELVSEFLGTGDRICFEMLVKRHITLIRRVLLALLEGNTEYAMDAEQEVLIRLYSHLHQYKRQSKLSTYLVGLTRNTALDELRKIRRHRRIAERILSLTPEPVREDDPVNTLVRNEERADIIRALDGLKSDERFICYMKDAEDWSLKEIAEALGRPVGTIKSKLSRSRKKFALMYQELIDEK